MGLGDAIAALFGLDDEPTDGLRYTAPLPGSRAQAAAPRAETQLGVLPPEHRRRTTAGQPQAVLPNADSDGVVYADEAGNLLTHTDFTFDGVTLNVPALALDQASIGVAELAFDPATQAELDGHASLGVSEAHGAVDTADLAADAVTQAKIAAGAVGLTELAFDPATQAELDGHASLGVSEAHGAVDTADLAADAVTQAKIAAGAVGLAELAFDPATQAELDAHTGDNTNPHGVTAAQAGALPDTAGTRTAVLHAHMDIPDGAGAIGMIVAPGGDRTGDNEAMALPRGGTLRRLYAVPDGAALGAGDDITLRIEKNGATQTDLSVTIDGDLHGSGSVISDTTGSISVNPGDRIAFIVHDSNGTFGNQRVHVAVEWET